MLTNVRLNQLLPGRDFPGGSVNMRTARDIEGLDHLAAIIRAEITDDNPSGLLQSLLVCPDPKNKGGDADKFYVIDGGRRLMALQNLGKGKALLPTTMIPVNVRADVTPGTAMAQSIAANSYLPPHPIDRYEAFAACEKGGMAPDAIATRFGVKLKLVQQSLALGKLSPKIRTAWREGKLRDDAAQVFTLCATTKQQDAIYDQLKRRGDLYANAIRHAITGDSKGDTARALRFVGKDAYKAAGGTIREDLFGEGDVVSDIVLLGKMVTEKTAAEVARLKAEGWAWVRTAEEVANDRHYYRPLAVKEVLTKDEAKQVKAIEKEIDRLNDGDHWREANKKEAEISDIRAAARLRAFTDKDRAKAGCIVGFDEDEEDGIGVEYGLVEPKEDKGGRSTASSNLKSDSAKAEKKPAGAISNALAQRLSEQLTYAASAAIVKEPELALAAIVAGFISEHSSHGTNYYDSIGIIDVEENGLVRKKGMHPNRGEQTLKAVGRKGAFSTNFADSLKAGAKSNLTMLAQITGRALDFQTRDAKRLPLKNPGVAALCEALDPKALNAVIRKQWDAKDYFESINNALRYKALDEALRDPHAHGRYNGLKKAELVAACIKEIPGTGWLPPELRTVHYDGPAGTKSTPKPRKPVAAKKAKAVAPAKPKPTVKKKAA